MTFSPSITNGLFTRDLLWGSGMCRRLDPAGDRIDFPGKMRLTFPSSPINRGLFAQSKGGKEGGTDAGTAGAFCPPRGGSFLQPGSARRDQPVCPRASARKEGKPV